MTREYAILPRPAQPIANATQVRGSVLLPALNYLQTHGYANAYFAALPSEHHAAMRGLLASAWAPAELIVAHCNTCDRLALPQQTLEAIGRETGSFLNAALVSSTLSVAREFGMTPWIMLASVEGLRERVWMGGRLAVTKLGPKEAILDWFGQPCGHSTYFRTVFGEFIRHFLTPLSTAFLLRPLDRLTKHADITFRLSWV